MRKRFRPDRPASGTFFGLADAGTGQLDAGLDRRNVGTDFLVDAKIVDEKEMLVWISFGVIGYCIVHFVILGIYVCCDIKRQRCKMAEELKNRMSDPKLSGSKSSSGGVTQAGSK